MRTTQQNSRNSESKVEWKENFREKVSENLVIDLARFGKYCAILYWKLPKISAEWKAPKVTKQIEVIHSVLTESLITAWPSGNGNKNFLTWNSKFQSDQTDGSKRTTWGSGPLWPQAAQQRTLFIFIHSVINSKSNELPQSLDSLCFDQKISTRKKAFHLFLKRKFPKLLAWWKEP